MSVARGEKMPRKLTVAAAQLGATQRDQSRAEVVLRMVQLVEAAHRRGAELVVFPELAFMTFFPKIYYEDMSSQEVDAWFETFVPSTETEPLFAALKRCGMAAHIGFGELAFEEDESGSFRKRRFNSAALFSPEGEIMLKYRKIHLPGFKEFQPGRSAQQLEKRFFEVGNLGFPVINAPIGKSNRVNCGILICNDRRWPEAWRCLGLQQVDLVMIGYNTTSTNMDSAGFQAPHMRVAQSHLSVQAGCYQNSCYAVSVAKAGIENGVEMFGESIIVNPQGEIIAKTSTWADEVITAECDFDLCALNRATMFNFQAHRRPEAYQRIVQQVGSVEPPVWKGSE